MSAAGGGLRITLSAFVFIFTGLVQTVCIQGVLYSGGGDRTTFLLAIPNYVGIVMVYLCGARCFRVLDRFGVWSSGGVEVNRVHHTLYAAQGQDAKKQTSLGFFARLFHPERRKLFVLAFNELGGFLTGITGLAIAGSGLYQVVFSGATVFTALLSTFFLRKRLSLMQWTFVAVISAGLMITAEQVAHSTTEAGAASLVSGVSFVLVSCLFYSMNYVIAEHFLDHHDPALVSEDDTTILPPPSGLDLSLYTGGSCLIIFGIYVSLHTLPHWTELVTSSIERHHGNNTIILEQYLYLTVASFFHAISHYDIVATVGAVPVGVLNAIRAVSVFGVSSLLFCTHQASQCYNSRKGASTAVVIIGAFGYSAASQASKARASSNGSRPSAHSRAQSMRKVRRSKSPSRPRDVGGMVRSVSVPFMENFEMNDARSGFGSWFGFAAKRRKGEGNDSTDVSS